MRRGIGLKGLENTEQFNASYKETGEILASEQIEQLKCQFSKFKSGLETFSRKYQKEISQNPALRGHFTKMCSKIGVDPLISSKGFWSEILGIGDFYYELAVQIVEICFSMREETGGLLDMNVLLEKIKRMRSSQGEIITVEDVERSIETLEPLGSGYKIMKINSKLLIQSVPHEFSIDQNIIFKYTDERGKVLEPKIIGEPCKWEKERFEAVIGSLILQGFIWVDSKTSTGTPEHWMLSLFKEK